MLGVRLSHRWSIWLLFGLRVGLVVAAGSR